MFEEYTDELAGSVTASYSGPADPKKKGKKVKVIILPPPC